MSAAFSTASFSVCTASSSYDPHPSNNICRVCLVSLYDAGRHTPARRVPRIVHLHAGSLLCPESEAFGESRVRGATNAPKRCAYRPPPHQEDGFLGGVAQPHPSAALGVREPVIIGSYDFYKFIYSYNSEFFRPSQGDLEDRNSPSIGQGRRTSTTRIDDIAQRVQEKGLQTAFSAPHFSANVQFNTQLGANAT
ncbi:hypothetical protein BDN70DRAFT_932407 [Pholiota conissans]|uniref:Uncharacterized protein n=1 Tax=Pholiota conissans TaxID=109636 RepID=A0A9P6CTP0_9AGAR|nr:hypothetical protein BDN70DRAFT_932407 [Pholiota conissans]